jgi:DNA-binding beta-propeller fold protein YncE
MAVSHDQNFVMTSDAKSNTVTFIDTKSLEVTSVVDIGGDHRTDLPPAAFQRLNPRISPEGKWLWVGNQDASETTIIDIQKQEKVKSIPSGLGADLIFFPLGPAEGYAFITNRYAKKVTVARLNGDKPPTFVGHIPTARIGSHYMTFDESWETAFVSERPGRAYSVFDMTLFASPNQGAVRRGLADVETASIWTGGSSFDARPEQWMPDYSDDYTRAGQDMAVYVWFEHGMAQVSEERGGD